MMPQKKSKAIAAGFLIFSSTMIYFGTIGQGQVRDFLNTITFGPAPELISNSEKIQIVGDAETDQLCSSYVGRDIAYTPLKPLKQQVDAFKAKSEFETTEQYDARLRAALSTLPETLIFPVPMNQQNILYDADSKNLSVSRKALTNRISTDRYMSDVVLQKPYANAIKHGPGAQFDLFFDRQLLSTYSATTRLGAKFTVTKYQDRTFGFFTPEPTSRGGITNSSFEISGESDSPIVIFETSSDAARILKKRISLAILFKPEMPFLLKGRRVTHRPTTDNPSEAIEDFSVMVGQPECVFVIEMPNRVMSAHKVVWG